MTKEEHRRYWILSATHDLESAESMFDSQRYDWCLFAGHLALEKILKAIYVDRNESEIPLKIHNLVRLAELSKIALTEEQRFDLDTINDFNIQARYPDYKPSTKNVTKNILTPFLERSRNFSNGSTP